MEQIASGIRMGESPRWHDGRLWLCDWLAGEVLTLDVEGGRGDGHGDGPGEAAREVAREVVVRFEGLPCSIDWLPDGRLVATTPAGLQVLEPGAAELSAYGGEGWGFNELVVDRAGRCWVDRPGSMPWEERRPGIVAVVDPDGAVREVADDVWFPNGMVLLEGPSDDGATLVVAESHADRLTAWTVTDDGDLVDRRVWADLGPGSAPDGICADAEGAIWYASVPGERCVRVAEGGRELAVVEADRGCFSCALGGADGRTLFVVANRYGREGASDGVVLAERVAVPAAVDG